MSASWATIMQAISAGRDEDDSGSWDGVGEPEGHAESRIVEAFGQMWPDLEEDVEEQVDDGYAKLSVGLNGTVVLPNNFNGNIRPGTFSEAVTSIHTGHALTHYLEPGVIGSSITSLVLGKAYHHEADLASVPLTVKKLFVHVGNGPYIPTHRPFYIYELDKEGDISDQKVGEDWVLVGEPFYERIADGLRIWAHKAIPVGLIGTITFDEEELESDDLEAEIEVLRDEIAKLSAFKQTVVEALAKLG